MTAHRPQANARARRWHGRGAWLLAAALASVACGDGSGPGPAPRRFLMGFSAIPPTPDTTLLLQTLTLSSAHADAGLVQLEIPWATLLSGIPADSEVRTVRLPLVNYYRGTAHKVVVALDVTDGLNRAAEAPELVNTGRSLTDTMVQRLYFEYVAAVDSILHPDYLSLAAETNLVRLIAPAPLYDAVVGVANAAATRRRAAGSTTPLLVSVQVETAWGGLQGGAFAGIARDLADFPFIDALGLSSYPYLANFAGPADLPLDYYARLVQGTSLPVLVLEGGWSSAPVSASSATPAVQAEYLARQARLLDATHAVGLFQITFTDINLSLFPPATATALTPFAHLGLVDSMLGPKPALASWDSVLARPYRP